MKRAVRGLVFVSLLVGGCTTEQVHEKMRVKAEPMSDFLPHHELLVRQAATFPFHYFYLKEDLSAYENVYIAPVNMNVLRESDNWSKFDQALSGKLGSQVADLCDFMHTAFVQAFERKAQENSGHLKVVDRKDLPKTLVLETAIVAVKPTKAELNVAGTAASFFLPGIGIVTSFASEGSITIECCVRDAKTGEIVAMFADTENDPKAVVSVAGYTWLRSARINIKMVADQTAKVLSTKDYRTIRRDFPIRFATLIKDASLEK